MTTRLLSVRPGISRIAQATLMLLAAHAANAQTAATTYHTGAKVLSLNTWYHIAISRKSGTTTLYLDDKADGSSSTAWNLSYTGDWKLGRLGGGSTLFTGYIDDFRLTKGATRY